MGKILILLSQRHPAHDDPVEYLRIITVIAVLVFLVLWIFTPFNFRRFPEESIAYYALLYAGTAYATMLMGLVWIVFFPKLFATETWTLGKEMLNATYQFTAVTLAVWLLSRTLEGWKPGGRSYLDTWSVVAADGILPYLVAISLKHVYQLRRHLHEATQLQNQLSGYPRFESKQPLAVRGLLVPLLIEEFHYAKSGGNQLHISAVKGGNVQTYTVRGTLKQLLADNEACSQLFQCHRTYIINLTHIAAVDGNAAGCTVDLGDALPEIPVSRTHVSGLKKALAGRQA
ncbi:LytTR family DNA-binding domain-containing protein [Parapedobacter koreensis]|uniref:LytTr DNA-binding domain-containing protein n=1 Tax=Parapedobacter koreensis TaxID=332977 RepID=A0A1H7TVW2_9SPHI|nr:LytTR family DNA-binding domain-containing protein [Parapedobacter koreensis]SEL88586.1 LytTr DNA-binding domain-containing protein [Parapedobacter koreensis]